MGEGALLSVRGRRHQEGASPSVVKGASPLMGEGASPLVGEGVSPSLRGVASVRRHRRHHDSLFL